jgi:ABC-type antimicrobial peptide transport system permease subunit
LVAQRTGEFGIRLALGARPRDILTIVLRQGARLGGIGIATGLIGAWLLARFLHGLMPRLAGVDPVALLGVALVLGAVAMVACYVPARRATRVDPLIALREE